MKRSVIVLGLMLLPVLAHAATLRELLDAAERRNLDRRISSAQRRRVAAEAEQAWSALFPSLSAQASWSYNQYKVEVPISPGGPVLVLTPQNQLDAVARVDLPLIDTTRWFRVEAADSADDAAGFRDDVTRDLVRRQVAGTYYGFAAALAVRDASKRSLELAEAQLKLQEVRLGEGAATELEVLRAKAEVHRNKQLVTESGALVATTRRALLSLTELDVGEEAKLPPDDLRIEGTLKEYERRTVELPVVKAAEKDLEAAERLKSAAKLALVPAVSANFTERLSNATGFLGKVAIFATGVGLTWRLDGPTLYGAAVQEEVVASAKLAAARAQQVARDQVFNDWERLVSAIEKVTAAKAQVESAERAAQLTHDRYEVGAVTQTDVVQAERDLFSAEVNRIQARTELASSRLALHISAGLPLGID